MEVGATRRLWTTPRKRSQENLRRKNSPQGNDVLSVNGFGGLGAFCRYRTTYEFHSSACSGRTVDDCGVAMAVLSKRFGDRGQWFALFGRPISSGSFR